MPAAGHCQLPADCVIAFQQGNVCPLPRRLQGSHQSRRSRADHRDLHAGIIQDSTGKALLSETSKRIPASSLSFNLPYMHQWFGFVTELFKHIQKAVGAVKGHIADTVAALIT